MTFDSKKKSRELLENGMIWCLGIVFHFLYSNTKVKNSSGKDHAAEVNGTKKKCTDICVNREKSINR